MGYNNRQKCVDFLNTRSEYRNWEDVKIILFDAPQATDKPYTQRLEIQKQCKFLQLLVLIISAIPKDHRSLSVVKPILCHSRDHLMEYYNQICKERPMDKRAEGVVLRDPNAWYFKADAFFTLNVSNNVLLYLIFKAFIGVHTHEAWLRKI
jgi:hypothetical protein